MGCWPLHLVPEDFDRLKRAANILPLLGVVRDGRRGADARAQVAELRSERRRPWSSRGRRYELPARAVEEQQDLELDVAGLDLHVRAR